jgi:hypothetical protein
VTADDFADMEAVRAEALRRSAAMTAWLFEPQHRDGLWWHEAPLPGRLHRCTPWTWAIDGSTVVRRCACGSISLNGRNWSERNSRRKRH